MTQEPVSTPRPPALLIVGHGTRSAAGVAEFAALVSRVRFWASGLAVGGGFIELSRPPLADAVAHMVAAGERDFGVVPLVLVAAGHAKGDIPAAIERERRRHPGTTYRYGRPLGPHPTLIARLAANLDAMLPADGRASTTVLLVGRGSTDPDANAEVAKVARLLWEGRGIGAVEYAFVSLAEPGVATALERCRRLGARRIVVLPYFLLPGVLPDRVVEQATAYAQAHPDLDVRCGGLLGDSDALADLVLERYREALAGDIRMSCDTCQYRVALPGFESRLNAPQHPHDHPDDPRDGHASLQDGHEHAHPVGTP